MGPFVPSKQKIGRPGRFLSAFRLTSKLEVMPRLFQRSWLTWSRDRFAYDRRRRQGR